jgi:cysteine dioxygenase
MIQTKDVHPLQSRVGDLVAGLRSLEQEPITILRVSELLTQMPLSPEALSPYLWWNSEHYTRNLIYRDHYFEVLALCWLPGQRTPIHSHNGQLGWMTAVQGELVCRNYRFVRAQSPSRELSRTPSKGGRPVEVELLESTTFQAGGSVTMVDRRKTTHRLENVETSPYGTVTLHVYSKPIDSAVLFDEVNRCCARQRMEYYSANGSVLQRTPVREEELAEAAA